MPSTTPKRKRPAPDSSAAEDVNEDTPAPSPKRPRADDTSVPESSNTATPQKRKRGRPPGSKNKPKSTPDSSARQKDVHSTPTKLHNGHRNGDLSGNDSASTPVPLLRSINRSAKRKSAQHLIDHHNGPASSSDEEDALAHRILNDTSSSTDSDTFPHSPTPSRIPTITAHPTRSPQPPHATNNNNTTPIKRGRGRPKGAKTKTRGLTPPPSYPPPHETYFFQNRPSAATKTSSNTLAALPAHLSLLTHDDYFSLIRTATDHHGPSRQNLLDLHSRSFPQWVFELSQGFNLCLYGLGSKRALIGRFLNWLSVRQPTTKIIVVNGYVATVQLREIFGLIASLLLPPNERLKGTQPTELLASLLALLSQPAHTAVRILLVIHSIDGPALRSASVQSLLSQLAGHARIALLASADHPLFGLLWDGNALGGFQWLMHDTTTFTDYEAEVDVVGSVDELLGRSGRRVGGKEGVGFVLRSLTGKARGLYRLLLGEVLGMDDDEEEAGAGGGDGVDDADEEDGRRARTGEKAVEYRVLYRRAAEEFIVGNELAFRAMLKEFHDHQMITSSKDAFGTELLGIPFRRGEMESILEDLME